MSDPIAITTGCRLHFGIFSHRPACGREFGGVGLMLRAPRGRLSFRPAERDMVFGPEDAASRFREFVARYRRSVDSDEPPPRCAIEIHESIPPHVGLGSGTQSALAVADGLARLAGEGAVDPVVLAERVGRGVRSAIGIHGYRRGGLLFDDGKTLGEPVGSLARRLEFPAEWRFLLVIPREETGLSGPIEREAFARLPPMPAETTARLRELAFEQLEPAVTAADFDATSDALHEFNRIVGEYFAPAQGGTYAHPRMRELVAELRREGIAGVGQSSWGPTIFALLRDAAEVQNLRDRLAAARQWGDCIIQISAASDS
ncbi:MAG: hypothetical protein WD066_14435 [Planctomycetaceae bacterium]